MHTYIHTYIHTYVHTYMHAYILYIHYVDTYTHLLHLKMKRNIRLCSPIISVAVVLSSAPVLSGGAGIEGTFPVPRASTRMSVDEAEAEAEAPSNDVALLVAAWSRNEKLLVRAWRPLSTQWPLLLICFTLLCFARV